MPQYAINVKYEFEISLESEYCHLSDCNIYICLDKYIGRFANVQKEPMFKLFA